MSSLGMNEWKTKKGEKRMKNFLKRILREGAMSARWLATLVVYVFGAMYASSIMVTVKDFNLTVIKAATSLLGEWGSTVELVVRDGGLEPWLMFYELWLVVGLGWWLTRAFVGRLSRRSLKPSTIMPTRAPSPT